VFIAGANFSYVLVYLLISNLNVKYIIILNIENILIIILLQLNLFLSLKFQ